MLPAGFPWHIQEDPQVKTVGDIGPRAIPVQQVVSLGQHEPVLKADTYSALYGIVQRAVVRGQAQDDCRVPQPRQVAGQTGSVEGERGTLP